MGNAKDNLLEIFPGLSKEEYCYLITTGRKSGKPHEIEIWFGIQGGTLYLLSGGGADSDWVKNLQVDPKVTVRIMKHSFSGVAGIVKNIQEESLARLMLAAKYQGWKEGQELSDWAQDALVVAVELKDNALNS